MMLLRPLLGELWSDHLVIRLHSTAHYIIVLQKRFIRRFVITEKARAFSWLKAATTAFTFKTLLRHYANQTARPL